MLSRLRAAIDINDVLHYYQFHFVLIFYLYFKLKSACCSVHASFSSRLPRVLIEIMIRQFNEVFSSLVSLAASHGSFTKSFGSI